MTSDTEYALCNCLAVRQAARQLTQHYDAALAPTGLRVTQYSVLARLSRTEPATMQSLAEALVLDRTTLNHNLKPLERDGLVTVEVDEGDGRVRRLKLTRAGRAKLKAAQGLWAAAQARFDEAFGGTNEASAFRKQLARAVDAAR